MWRIVFQVFPLVVWCVAILVVVKPLKFTRRTSLVLSFVILAALSKFAFFAVVGGNGFNPDLPAGLIWFCGWIYAAAILLTGFAFVCMIGDGILNLCRPPVRLRTKRIRTVLLTLAAAAVSLWGIYEGVCIPSVHRVEVFYNDLPPAFDGYRIVHLSDLHCSTAARRERFERIVARVNALAPDLIAITGDFVDGTPGERREDLEPIEKLKAKDGVWGCTGNHEAYWNWYGWADLFRKWDVRILSEHGVYSNSVIRRGESALALGGLTDPAFFKGAGYRLSASSAFRNVPPGAFRILLAHRPFTERIGSAVADVRLQLSGHTHGGAVPLLRLLVSYVNEGYVRGLYEFAPGRFLHVSPGTGQWAGFPLRLFNPAEITEIVLRLSPQTSQPPNLQTSKLPNLQTSTP